MTHETPPAHGGHDHGPSHDHGGHHPHSDHGSGPDHPHEAVRGRGLGNWWGSARHGLSQLLGTHSHDTADQVDAALEADHRGWRALWISLGALGLTAVAQAVVVLLTGSVALLGDTLHNVADALTAVPLLVAFGFVGNELVARYRLRVGKDIGSAALVADGLHARTDGFTSLAVVIGAAGVAVGLPWADPVVGLVIAIAIVAVLRSAVAQVGARLMDAVNPALVHSARAAIATVGGVLAVSSLRIRWIGHTLHAEADITVSPDMSVSAGHDIAHHAEQHLLEQLPRLTAAVIHVSPSGAHDGTDGGIG